MGRKHIVKAKTIPKGLLTPKMNINTIDGKTGQDETSGATHPKLTPLWNHGHIANYRM